MKKGSTLIEAVISMAILLIALTLSTQIFSLSSKSILTRRNKEKANRVSYAIEKEIKYFESKHIQKFMVLYGSAGTGKSTILNIIQNLKI